MLTKRQKEIISIVSQFEPISGDEIASKLDLSKSTIRSDLSFLSHMDYLDARQKVGYLLGKKNNETETYSEIAKMKVSEVMAVPEVIDESLPLYDAIATMFLANVGSIYIHKNKSLVGVVSRKDMIKSMMGGADISKLPVGIVMTRMPNVVWVTPNTTVVSAAQLIISHQIDSLPVVEVLKEEGKTVYRVVGRFSKTVVSKLFCETFSEN
ncbi:MULTISPECIES: helix-turn-helix transcriptional regulator [unclassified Fusibacter]|uniref:helix-turn-helix transcriptional regulator n=1 Tax=unclassified Fusibacter TaxID=2624464 RepID=UPI0010111A1E|nr:helix-turn-helix transcriptional regulator [Fusibacter sp. A1]MCK8058115.1 helix-turn-helix transcriptional regulator [Fusibacter sp. A2]NPE20697.1 helix-turn-helix transcriptional regulator [Fusibacter sp. A1]